MFVVFVALLFAVLLARSLFGCVACALSACLVALAALLARCLFVVCFVACLFFLLCCLRVVCFAVLLARCLLVLRSVNCFSCYA